ncbi:MAG: sulfite exporter TauE/SafE family protein [Gemmatimonadota bacterium]|nr:sulfite exporter TauE/SafE family protein [Gemmatimonadota bacterium]
MPRLRVLAIGLVSGSFGGLLGIGGGVVMVPLLTGWGRLDQHSAHGTSLVGVVATGLVGAAVYGKGASVDWVAAGLLALGAVPATVFASRASVRIPAGTLQRGFGAFLLFTAALLPFKGAVPVTGLLDGTAASVSLVALGVLVGALSGLLGVGGGAVMVPALALGPGFVQQLAQGTSLAAMIPSGAMGAAVHARVGHVRARAAVPLVAGIAAGSWAGGSFALGLPAPLLRAVFSVVLVWLGLRYLRRGPATRGLEAKTRAG